MKSIIKIKVSIFLIFLISVIHSQKEHSHSHEAPHDGLLIELGEHFGLMEILHDSKTGTLKAWFFDSCAENYVRIKKQRIEFVIHGRFLNPPEESSVSFVMIPKSNILTGESVNSTSQYHVSHEKLKNSTRLKGMFLNINYKGNDFKNITFDTGKD